MSSLGVSLSKGYAYKKRHFSQHIETYAAYSSGVMRINVICKRAQGRGPDTPLLVSSLTGESNSVKCCCSDLQPFTYLNRKLFRAGAVFLFRICTAPSTDPRPVLLGATAIRRTIYAHFALAEVSTQDQADGE